MLLLTLARYYFQSKRDKAGEYLEQSCAKILDLATRNNIRTDNNLLEMFLVEEEIVSRDQHTPLMNIITEYILKKYGLHVIGLIRKMSTEFLIDF